MLIKSKITPIVRGWYDECLLVINEPLRNDVEKLMEMINIHLNDVFSWKIDYFYMWFNNYIYTVIKSLFTIEKLILIPFLKGRISNFNFEMNYYDDIFKKLDKIVNYRDQLKMNLSKNIVNLRKMIEELVKDIVFFLDYKETIIPDILKENFSFMNKTIFLSIINYNSYELNKILIPWVVNYYEIWYNEKKKTDFVNILPKNIRSNIKKWTKSLNKRNNKIYNLLIQDELYFGCCTRKII